MKLFATLILLIGSVQTSHALMFRTLAIDLRASNLLFCYAGYDNSSLEDAVTIVNAKRYKPGPEGDRIPRDSGISDFLEDENLQAFYAGRDFKRNGTHENKCDRYSVNRVRELAMATDNEDFIRRNPQEFEKYEPEQP
ncbi:TPA: hypothetical protein MB324_004102 [Klebsiella pneumoniae]|nr:hypothetical protein [Klebsiella pneumoniae]